MSAQPLWVVLKDAYTLATLSSPLTISSPFVNSIRGIVAYLFRWNWNKASSMSIKGYRSPFDTSLPPYLRNSGCILLHCFEYPRLEIHYYWVIGREQNNTVFIRVLSNRTLNESLLPFQWALWLILGSMSTTPSSKRRKLVLKDEYGRP